MSITVYSIPELMPILRLGKRAIRKLMLEGELQGRLVGRQWLITEEALKAYLHSPEEPMSGTVPR